MIATPTLRSAREQRRPAGSRIRLEGVSRRYQVGGREVCALQKVDLRVDEDAFVVILGPSGSGKTTLLNMIGALDTPTEGRIVLNGVDLTAVSRTERRKARRNLVSFIFQSFNLFPALTALENVQFGADVAGRGDAGRLARHVLSQVGLRDRFDHFPQQLSGGEQQRVAIARALATGNPILLADEPTGELDAATGIAILELLIQQSREGHTVLVVTHNREIARVADRVVELSSGRIVQDGPPLGGREDLSALYR